LPFRALSEAETRRFLFELLGAPERERLEATQELDFLYALPGVGRFRVNMFVQSHGYGAAFRIIPDKPPELDALGFPAIVRHLTTLSSGLVLIGGPTGSGKTTTLAAIVHEINKTAQKHVITIEDPIEFLHEPIRSIITQRQVGAHIESFAEAVRSALREAPDVLVVGEVREHETLQLALQAAETGVLAFGTLHTSSAPKTLSRVLDMAPEDVREQLRATLAVHLRGVLAQHLVKRASGDGRIAAIEVLANTQAVASMIRDNKVAQIEGMLQSATPESGMQSLDQCLVRLLKDGVADPEDALSTAEHPEVLKRALAQIAAEQAEARSD
ncbi:MAG TPA: PilT/PilU family type 4a pilus ATPase, partial [Myxococcota bacterium]